jgi:hypothetical protein
MKLYAVTMMKDEEDVADLVLYHLASQGVDGIIVADNMSTDSTSDKLHEAKKNLDIEVIITQDDEIAYTQSEKMTKLGHQAAGRGATWIIPFDADELWFGVGGTLKEVLTQADADGKVSAKADYWNHRITHEDVPGNPFTGMRYREKEFTGFYKAIYKYRRDITLSNGNHFIVPPDDDPFLGVVMRHFPLRSEEQFVKKMTNGYHACRALSKDHDLYNGAGWSPYFPVYEAEGVEGLKRVYQESYFNPEGFVYDPAPYKSN